MCYPGVCIHHMEEKNTCGFEKWYNVTARSRFPHQQLSVSEILKQPTIILLSHRCERRLKGFSHVLTVLTFHLEKGGF